VPGKTARGGYANQQEMKSKLQNNFVDEIPPLAVSGTGINYILIDKNPKGGKAQTPKGCISFDTLRIFADIDVRKYNT
jgi:hypothetical protein